MTSANVRKTRAVALKRFCLAMKALPRTVTLKANSEGRLVTKTKILRFGMRCGMKSKDFRRVIDFRSALSKFPKDAANSVA